MPENKEIEDLVNKKVENIKRRKILNSLFWIIFISAIIIFVWYNLNFSVETSKILITEKDSIQQILKDSLKKIVPKAYAEKSNFDISTKKQMYNYYVYLSGNKETLYNIDSVRYFFNHKSFIVTVSEINIRTGDTLKREVRDERIEKSSNPNDSFKVSYQGWGVLENVPIYIFNKDSKIDTINFKMYDNLQIRGIIPKWD